MKLLQGVDFSPDRERAPGSIIDLYGMPIVNDVQRDGVLIEFERRQVRLSSTLDVDR
jgi:hypothetical protein